MPQRSLSSTSGISNSRSFHPSHPTLGNHEPTTLFGTMIPMIPRTWSRWSWKAMRSRQKRSLRHLTRPLLEFTTWSLAFVPPFSGITAYVCTRMLYTSSTHIHLPSQIVKSTVDYTCRKAPQVWDFSNIVRSGLHHLDPWSGLQLRLVAKQIPHLWCCGQTPNSATLWAEGRDREEHWQATCSANRDGILRSGSWVLIQLLGGFPILSEPIVFFFPLVQRLWRSDRAVLTLCFTLLYYVWQLETIAVWMCESCLARSLRPFWTGTKRRPVEAGSWLID